MMLHLKTCSYCGDLNDVKSPQNKLLIYFSQPAGPPQESKQSVKHNINLVWL